MLSFLAALGGRRAAIEWQNVVLSSTVGAGISPGGGKTAEP